MSSHLRCRVYTALLFSIVVGLMMVFVLGNSAYLRPDSSSAVRALHRRLVTVTAVSDNHLHEVQDLLKSVLRCLPRNKIIVYDLGLKEENRRKLTGRRNVDLRIFPFANYSHFSHVKNLLTYAWKPIIIKEVSLEYDIIMYCDASIRMKSCDINKAFARLLEFPIFATVPRPYKTVEFTHDGMIDYLHYPKDRKDISGMTTIAATGFLLWANATMREKLIDPWLDCALHKECIAPEGSQRWPCRYSDNHDGHYVGCHRYDQSALNLILAREFGPEVVSMARNEELANSLWAVNRFFL